MFTYQNWSELPGCDFDRLLTSDWNSRAASWNLEYDQTYTMGDYYTEYHDYTVVPFKRSYYLNAEMYFWDYQPRAPYACPQPFARWNTEVCLGWFEPAVPFPWTFGGRGRIYLKTLVRPYTPPFTYIYRVLPSATAYTGGEPFVTGPSFTRQVTAPITIPGWTLAEDDWSGPALYWTAVDGLEAEITPTAQGEQWYRYDIPIAKRHTSIATKYSGEFLSTRAPPDDKAYSGINPVVYDYIVTDAGTNRCTFGVIREVCVWLGAPRPGELFPAA
jgi:hypothetical protein